MDRARKRITWISDGRTPPPKVAYTFLLGNPECFGFDEWPEDMPSEPNIEFIAAYFAAYQD